MAYTWAKRGVHRLVRRESVRFGQVGARISSVTPGMIDTLMGRQEAEARPTTNDMLVRCPRSAARAVPRKWRPARPSSSLTRRVSSPGSTFPSMGVSWRRSAAVELRSHERRGRRQGPARPGAGTSVGRVELPPLDAEGLAALRADRSKPGPLRRGDRHGARRAG